MFNPRAVKRALPFSIGTADRLMKIARSPVIGDGYSAHAPNFPPNWTVLYELTKLPGQELAAGGRAMRPLQLVGETGLRRTGLEIEDIKARMRWLV